MSENKITYISIEVAIDAAVEGFLKGEPIQDRL